MMPVKLTKSSEYRNRKWLCILLENSPEHECAAHVLLTTSQMRQLSAMLTKEADKLEAAK